MSRPKHNKLFVLLKKHYITILFVILLVLFVYNKSWWGVGGLFIFISAIQILRVVVFFKSMPWIKELMLTHIKRWEAAQLGHDLDDPYWDDKVRPTRWQKLRGIDPNIDYQENKRRREINRELTKQLSFKDKYLNIFDYKSGSKAIYLVLAITLAIVLIRQGLNILIVFGIIFALGGVKKLIDKKYGTKRKA